MWENEKVWQEVKKEEEAVVVLKEEVWEEVW
jgi:hypothetical protein